uniref:Catechol 2,3-dioxygenase n=1 Tax=Candidatus Kentrum sp. UNK TaxID=2126344 RepID=A0A451A2Y7_9GAMM|nr:MAG: Catechol 2,3-dioxygenase [Candidatus Kentron sp. UNK]VFK69237.1 MAG: Catechol 2,3-dioxygenase [Candidatus Kentron sp. UNK]
MKSFSHIGILVNNLSVMEEFYRDILGMRIIWSSEGEKSYLTYGNNDVLGLQQKKHDVGATIDLNTIRKKDINTPMFFHFGVMIDSKEEYIELLDRIKNNNIIISEEKTSRDGSVSVYFSDPEKNCIQVSYAPRNYYEQSKIWTNKL